MARYEPRLCAEFRKYVENWRKYFRDNIQQYHDYHNFVMGSQWEDDEEQILKNYNKIPLQFNKLAPLINHLCGEQRMNTPQLETVPDSYDMDPQTVKVRDALVKGIVLDSDAQEVYQIAFQQAAVGGFGAYQIASDYINNMSFNQVPMIQQIRDATKCFWDVAAELPSKVDGMQAGRYARMSRRLFRKKYGRKVEAGIPPTVTETEDDSYASFKWVSDDSITIGIIYVRKFINETIYQLGNDQVIGNKEYDKLEKVEVPEELRDSGIEEFVIMNGDMIPVLNKRKITNYKIKCYKWAGDYILEESEFPAKNLPIIFVDQNSYWDKTGKQVCRPAVKDARDAQRFINYLKTQIAYLVKISRYDQFIVSRANIKSPKTQLIWRNPTIVQGAIPYDVDKEGGTKPEQLRPPELPASLLQQYDSGMMDIQTSTGLYATKLGDQGTEISGAAIDARTRQGSYNTYIIFNALNRAIATGAEIINDMIPHLFDTERRMTLDFAGVGKHSVVLNEIASVYGDKILNDMTQGSYKIRLKPGPSYAGQEAQALQALQLVLQANPQLFPMIADLYAENLPVSNKIELVNRLRTLVPPEMIEAGKTGKPPQKKEEGPPPEIMIKLKELAIREKEVDGRLQDMQMRAQNEGINNQLEVEKMELEKLRIAGEIQEQILRYQAETDRTQADIQVSHASNIVELLTRPNKYNQHEPRSNKNH